MKSDAIKPIIERSRAGGEENSANGAWLGWSKRRIALSAYFGGEFIACLIFTAVMRIAFPLYTEVHYQLGAVQSAIALISVGWFVPSMVGDFRKAVGRQVRGGGLSLSLAVSGLARNIIMLGLLSAAATLPFALLFPSGDIVGHAYYTSDFRLFWGFHVLLACCLLAIFTVIFISIGCAVMMLVRSLAAYRLIALFFIFVSTVSAQPAYNLLAGFGVVPHWDKFTDRYWSLGQLNFTSYFRDFVSDVDGGSFMLNHIPELWGKILVALIGRAIFACVVMVLFLWLCAGLNLLYSSISRRQSLQQKLRAAAEPWLAFLSIVFGMGFMASILLHNTSYLLVTSYMVGQSSTPFDLMLLALIIGISYIAVSAAADALQSSSLSGFGDSLRVVVWRLLRGGTGLVSASIFAGMFYLALFAKMAGYGAAELLAGFGLLLLAGAAMLTLAAAVLVLGRLTRGLWGYGDVLQGFVIMAGLGWGIFLLFTRHSAESLIVKIQGDPANLAATKADEAARLSANSYPALVHAWLRSFDVSAANPQGMVQLALAVLAAVAAIVLALSMLARITRRLA
jgi:hypothetical protein